MRGRFCALVLAAIIAPQVFADTPFPGQPPNRELLEIQSRVDGLFKAGKYDRAMVIYRKELAPLGDKYAQYMIGYMHLAGKGVDQDLATAAAWYRLAAERGQPTFVSEYRNLVAALPSEEVERAEEGFVDIRKRYGDAALVMSLVDDDLGVLLRALRNDTIARSDLVRGPAMELDGKALDEMEQQIAERLDYVELILSDDVYADDADRARYAELAARARRLLAAARGG